MGPRNDQVSRLTRIEQRTATAADRDTGPLVAECIDPDDVDALRALGVVLAREGEGQGDPARVEQGADAARLLWSRLQAVEALAERLGRRPTLDEIRAERERSGWAGPGQRPDEQRESLVLQPHLL